MFLFLQVGFLKTQHKYEIVFTLPEVPALGKDVCPAPVPNPYLQIKDITEAPEGRNCFLLNYLLGVSSLYLIFLYTIWSRYSLLI